MAISPQKLARLRALIALAGSPEIEEARSAAYKACQIMREEQIDPTDVIALLGPGPSPQRAPDPPAPAWQDAPRLSAAQIEYEREQAVERALRFREAEVNAIRRRLWEVEQELRRRDAEEAARFRQAQQRRELAYLRKPVSTVVWRNGAGSKWW